MDPYLLLGVSRQSSQDDIKKAYRKLAKKYHPDLNPGKPEIEKKFKDITAAYDLLSDPEKRLRFDRGEIDASGAEMRAQYYRTHQQRNQQAGQSQSGAGFDFSDMFGGDDLFSRIFKTGGPKPDTRATASKKPIRGNDLSYTLRIGFIEAATGGTRKLTLGHGKSLSVQIPAGTEEGKILRLRGQGHKGTNNGPTGDALIEIHIEPHPFFTRKDLDIHLDVPISLKESVLGGKIQVPTIHGAVVLTLPPGTNSGVISRLKGKGIELSKDKIGDFYLHFKIIITDPKDEALNQFLTTWQETPESTTLRQNWDQKA